MATDAAQFAVDVFRAQACDRGEQAALHFNGHTTSYAALDRRSNSVAQALLADGVLAGDRIAVLTRNCAHFFEVLAGTAKIRACLAPINFRLATVEIAFILADMAPTLMFVSKEFLAVATEAASILPCPLRLIVLDADASRHEAYARWRDAAPAKDPALQPAPGDDLLLLYTSGTTGHPKGVRLTNLNYQCFLGAITDVPGFSYGAGETVFSTMPLFHVAGINVGMAGLAQGCTVVLVSDFVARDFLRVMEQSRANHAFLAPSMIVALLQTPEVAKTDFSSLKVIAYGSAPIAAESLCAARARFGCEFAQLYGMTESTGAGTYLSPSAHMLPGKQGSCGVPWPGLEIRIVDPQGHSVAGGEVGELVMSGGFVTPGYRNRPEASADAIRDGWLHTGDAGYFDADGYLFIHDRMKDMIVTGGENVFPAEVENAIFGCPGVADVAVIGIPSGRWGEEVKAVVVAVPGATLDAREVIAWAKDRIASYKAPKSVDFVAALPRNAAGKILKRELRKPYWEGRKRQVN